MGLIAKILTFPVSVPIGGLIWIAQLVADQVEQELYDGDKVRAQLLELELDFDMGKMTEEDYMASEEVLLARLKVIEQRLKDGG